MRLQQNATRWQTAAASALAEVSGDSIDEAPEARLVHAAFLGMSRGGLESTMQKLRSQHWKTLEDLLILKGKHFASMFQSS